MKFDKQAAAIDWCESKNGSYVDAVSAHIAGQTISEKRVRESVAAEIFDLLHRRGRYKGSTRDRITELFDLQAELRNKTTEEDIHDFVKNANIKFDFLQKIVRAIKAAKTVVKYRPHGDMEVGVHNDWTELEQAIWDLTTNGIINLIEDLKKRPG